MGHYDEFRKAKVFHTGELSQEKLVALHKEISSLREELSKCRLTIKEQQRIIDQLIRDSDEGEDI